MNIKVAVGFALFASFFLAGSILIFGFIKSSFIWTYFFFIFLTCIMAVYSIKESFEGKKEIALALALAMLVAVFAVFLANTAKGYFEESQQFVKDNQDMLAQIDLLKQNNENYVKYIDNLIIQIRLTQENSRKLQAQIDLITNQEDENPQVNDSSEVVNNSPKKILERDEEEKEEDEDDD